MYSGSFTDTYNTNFIYTIKLQIKNNKLLQGHFPLRLLNSRTLNLCNVQVTTNKTIVE